VRCSSFSSLLTDPADHSNPSSTWQQRSFEFASSLFLISLFPASTLYISLNGFFTTGAAILLSGTVGHLVDVTRRLKFVRTTVVVQKGVLAVGYAVFLACFMELEETVKRGERPPILKGMFAVLIVLSMGQNLAAVRGLLFFPVFPSVVH
jgi:iron-regulated transporter 1